MFQMLCGAIGMGYVAIALFFLRSWRTTGDRLFLAFCVAFVMLAMQRLAVGVIDPLHENALPTHVLRLLAYCTIVLAILDKNRDRKPRTPHPQDSGVDRSGT